MDSIMGILIPGVIVIIILIAVFFLIASFSSNIEKGLDPAVGRYLKYLEKEFATLDLPVTPKRFMMLQISSTLILFALGVLIMDGVPEKLFVGFVLGSIGFLGGRFYVTSSKERRANKFDEQFVDAIALISNGVRSGLSLMQALDLVVNEMHNPMSYELNLVIQSTRVGIPLDMALTELSQRVKSSDLDIFVTAVIIQRQTGGNLTEILETLGRTIRERFKLQRSIKALTAQGTASAYVLTFLPIILGIALYFVQPETMKLLFVTNYGILLLIIIAVMISIGGFIVKKIVTIDI